MLSIYIVERRPLLHYVFRCESPKELENMFDSMGLAGKYWWTFGEGYGLDFLENTLNLLDIKFEYTNLKHEDFVEKFKKVHLERIEHDLLLRDVN